MGVMDDESYEVSRDFYEINTKVEQLSEKIDAVDKKASEGCSYLYSKEVDVLIDTNQPLVDSVNGIATKLGPDFLSHFDKQTVENTKSLVGAISSLPEGSYILALGSAFFSAMVAAGVAFYINHLYVKYLNKVNEKAYYAVVSLSLLDEFESIAVRYWVTNKSDLNKEDMSVYEVKMVSILKVLRASLENVDTALSDVNESCKEVIQNFSLDVFDLATGDTFQGEDKESNFYIAKKIAAKCSSLKSVLLKHSKEVKS